MNPTRSRDVSVFVVTVVCVAAAIAHATSQAQGPPPATTFRSGVAYVEVDAVVTDADGHFVPGLQASDFLLLEDGQPRKISAFSSVDLGVPEGEGRPVVAGIVSQDTSSNEHVRPGRLYVVVLDDLHTLPVYSQRTRDMVRRFVQRYIGRDDLVAVLSTAPQNRIVTDFTASHEVLLASVERFLGRKPSWTPAGGTAASSVPVACFT